MIAACTSCLRRAYLVGLLAARIGGLLDHPRRRAPGLLALPEAELIAATAGGEEARRFVAAFEIDAARGRIQGADVGAVCRHESAYPEGLRDLSDPPPVLFFRGDPALLKRLAEEPAVTIVGTRNPSPYGLEMARGLAAGLSAAGLSIVSGLALGIDGAAHRGCLDAGGVPVAVLAGGADQPYPARHRSLYGRVREAGLILSELPPGQRAYRWSFPARNRLMAGLGAMTVVVEAAPRSGSLITVEFAQDMNRPVGAVPGRATSRFAAGSNALLREGAALVSGAEEVLDELFGVGMRRVPTRRQTELEPGLQRVLEGVEAGEDLLAIGRRAELQPGRLRAALAALESLGLIRRCGLGEYERVAGYP